MNELDSNQKKVWANLIDENGLDGAPKGNKFSEETKKKMSKSGKGRIFSEEHKENLRKARRKRKDNTCSEETKRKISIANSKPRPWMIGFKHSEETNRQNSIRQKGVPKLKLQGLIKSDEHKLKISESLTGKKHNIVKCPYCNKEGGENAMKRYHFSNCKLHINGNR